MQQYKLHKKFVLHGKLYQKPTIDESEYSSKVYERLEKIELFKKMRSEGCTITTAVAALKVPQSTLYRWKKNYERFGLAGLEKESTCPNTLRKSKQNQATIKQILHLRKQNPLYGRAKIAVLLRRDHNISISASSVGRILKGLIRRKQIMPARFYYGRKKVKPRTFNKHAQRWKKGMKSTKPGELMQIDHASIWLGTSFPVKHFQAICPFTKMVAEQAYNSATSHSAATFLDYVISSLPFPVHSIQVDGGSEFMKDFEVACQERNIPLFVLPPKTPENNGNVERANGAAKYEFYAFYNGELNLKSVRVHLKRYVKKYNTYRPHQALQYLTPQQYYTSLSEA